MRSGIALTVLAVVLAAGCAPTSQDVASDEVGETPDDVASAGDSAEDATDAVTVSIRDFFFDPDTLAVEAGDTVTWTHDGDITHNVTARDGSFASENLASGETFAHTFAEAGSFEYRCTLHGQMLASIDVS